MKLLTQFTTAPKQRLTIQLDDGNEVAFYFEYKSNQLGWFFDFTYNNETYSNIRLTTSYNILRAYKSWLPFGVRCDTLDGFEPMGKIDLYTGYAKIFILSKDDVITTEGNFYVKATA